MSAETLLRDVLAASAELAAVVGTRVYPDAMPEESPYPAVVYTRTGTEPIVTIDGTVHGAFVQLQVAAWATTRTAADDAADAVEIALQSGGDIPTARQGGFDPDTGLFAASMSVTLVI